MTSIAAFPFPFMAKIISCYFNVLAGRRWKRANQFTSCKKEYTKRFIFKDKLKTFLYTPRITPKCVTSWRFPVFPQDEKVGKILGELILILTSNEI